MKKSSRVPRKPESPRDKYLDFPNQQVTWRKGGSTQIKNLRHRSFYGSNLECPPKFQAVMAWFPGWHKQEVTGVCLPTGLWGQSLSPSSLSLPAERWVVWFPTITIQQHTRGLKAKESPDCGLEWVEPWAKIHLFSFISWLSQVLVTVMESWLTHKPKPTRAPSADPGSKKNQLLWAIWKYLEILEHGY
jgi:hypothetical protein